MKFIPECDLLLFNVPDEKNALITLLFEQVFLCH